MLWKRTVRSAFVIVTFHVTLETVLSAKRLLTAITGAEEGSFACRNEEAMLVLAPGMFSPLTWGRPEQKLLQTEPTSVDSQLKAPGRGKPQHWPVLAPGGLRGGCFLTVSAFMA